MKKLLNEWRKYLKESAENNEENRNRLVTFMASGLPEDQQPGFVKSETRKMMLDEEYFHNQWQTYEQDMLEAGA